MPPYLQVITYMKGRWSTASLPPRPTLQPSPILNLTAQGTRPLKGPVEGSLFPLAPLSINLQRVRQILRTPQTNAPFTPPAEMNYWIHGFLLVIGFVEKRQLKIPTGDSCEDMRYGWVTRGGGGGTYSQHMFYSPCYIRDKFNAELWKPTLKSVPFLWA